MTVSVSAGLLGHGPDEVLLAFTTAHRAAGVPVTSDRSQTFLAATAAVGLDDVAATWAAGRATLCGSPDDLDRYDQVFEAFFDHRAGLPRATAAPPASQPVPTTLPLEDPAGGGAGEEEDDDVVRARASDAEVLRHRDVATLSAGEKSRLAAMFTTLQPRPPRRRTARHQRWHRGEVDASRTLRASLRRAGEPAEIVWRRRATAPRRVVLLVDVSGSMSGYADALLRLAHRTTTVITARGGRVETFAVGTRLTHLSRAMRVRDPERALVAAGDAVSDWSGGTRLGETLKVFVDRWGRRGLARGAVVVVLSDGWEREHAHPERVPTAAMIAYGLICAHIARVLLARIPGGQSLETLGLLTYAAALVAGTFAFAQIVYLVRRDRVRTR